MQLRFRGLISLLLLSAFLVLVCSGAVLYITPQGRVANWTGWTLLGLTKQTWQAVHTSVALLFLLGAVFHLWLNWKTLWGYIKVKTRLAINCKWELLAALLITAATVLAAIYNVPPVSTLMDWNSRIKEYWERTAASVPAPVQHAEELTLRDLAAGLTIEIDDLKEKLAQMGIVVDSPDETLDQLARKHNISPRDLYAKITASFPEARWTGRGAGLGRGPGLGKGAGAGKRSADSEQAVPRQSGDGRGYRKGLGGAGAEKQ